MKMSGHKYRFKIFMILITAALIFFAFIHSSMPADISSDESEAVMNILQDILRFIGFSAELTDHIVRKAAHFCEYSAIGIFLMNTAYSFCKTRPHKYCLQIGFFGLLTAVIDEAIQLNVPGRSGQITDVLLDFSGIITGAFAIWIILLIYRKIRGIK